MRKAIIQALRRKGLNPQPTRGGFFIPGEGFLSLSAAKELLRFDEARFSRQSVRQAFAF